MIHPKRRFSSELYIHEATAAIWQKFIQLDGWPTWQPDVNGVQWLAGMAWQEDAQFAVATSSGQTTRFVIRMVAPGSVTVWESTSPALNAVYAFHCTDQVGGCKVTMSCTYHGFSALGSWFQTGRYRAQLNQTLVALKAHFDRK